MTAAGEPLGDLHPGTLLGMLGTNGICRSVVLYDRVDSTNGAAMRAAESGTAGGTLFIAREQSRGRGRAGRSWASTAGKSLLFTLLLRPPRDAGGLTALLAAASAGALDGICEGVMVKWPNDVFIGGAKAAGILAESKGGAVAIGMGLNVNEEPGDFPADLRGAATSLAIESGRARPRGEVLVRILKGLDDRYAAWCGSGLAPFVRELERRLLYMGELVTLEGGSERVTGIMRGLTEDGRLRLEVGGIERIFASGDLSLRRRPE